MKQMILTRKDILTDIERFEDRIRRAKKKLAALPPMASSFKERNKLKTKRRQLIQEIEHVKGLIRIAKEAIGGTENCGITDNMHTPNKTESRKAFYRRPSCFFDLSTQF